MGINRLPCRVSGLEGEVGLTARVLLGCWWSPVQKSTHLTTSPLTILPHHLPLPAPDSARPPSRVQDAHTPLDWAEMPVRHPSIDKKGVVVALREVGALMAWEVLAECEGIGRRGCQFRRQGG